jgi:catechol 2,3-dioxygenase-like lactoylglutathione lyase family enzyme
MRMDVGNIVHLEHVNVRIPDQRLATIFYVSGLGLTRDPYLMTGIDNMWVNVGRSQFHMPTGQPQVLRGHVGLVLPNRANLLKRLAKVGDALAGTKFAVREFPDFVEAVSPWGNRIRCFEPAPHFGPFRLAMPYVEFEAPVGTARSIARFYREIFEAPAELEDDKTGAFARVTVGDHQHLIFRETAAEPPPYDNHHIQIYVANYAASCKRLEALGLVTEHSNEHQYRVTDLIDLDTRKTQFVIEHEVRSLRNPLYARPLVNRNPDQTNMSYVPGADALSWQLTAAE